MGSTVQISTALSQHLGKPENVTAASRRGHGVFSPRVAGPLRLPLFGSLRLCAKLFLAKALRTEIPKAQRMGLHHRAKLFQKSIKRPKITAKDTTLASRRAGTCLIPVGTITNVKKIYH